MMRRPDIRMDLEGTVVDRTAQRYLCVERRLDAVAPSLL